MAVVAIACLIGLVAVAVAVLRDQPLAERLRPPDWDLLPAPVEVARVEFPLTFPGYDPATVEVTIEALNEAYADLLAVAPPVVVERARRRAAVRAGRDPDAVAPMPPTTGSYAAPADTADDREALRAEAALAVLIAAAPTR